MSAPHETGPPIPAPSHPASAPPPGSPAPAASVDPDSMLGAALAYAAKGWPVLPLWGPEGDTCACGNADCGSPAKHPVGTLVPHGLQDASTDPDAIRGWWGACPSANVGIRTGSESGIFALDVDPAHGGEEALAALESHHDKLPPTLEQVTGGGGRHLLFAHPDQKVKTGTNVPGPGMDVRGDGGYIVAPPSVHVSGTRYRWKQGAGPTGRELADATPWLLEQVRAPESRPATGRSFTFDPTRAQEIKIVKAALAALKPERADDYEMWILVGMSMHSVDSGPAMLHLWIEWSRQSPKFREGECAEKWRGFRPDGDVGLPTLTRMAQEDSGGSFKVRSGPAAVTSQVANSNTPVVPDASWPDPLDPAALYGLAGDIVSLIEPHTEADPAALLIQVLVAFGSVIGRTAYFVADGSTHHLVLFATLVGTTSKGRKGTSWGRIFTLFEAIDEPWARDRVQSGLSTGEGLIWAVRDPIEKREPVRDKGRATGEYDDVEVDPGVDDKRLLALEAEFASLLRVLGREGNTLSPVVRQAWDCGRLRTLTKNSPATATGAHISIVGHVTRDELRRYLTTTEAGNGFANRFLWACVRRSKCLPEGGRVPADKLEELGRRLSEAVTFAQQAGELRRDDTARAVWADVYPALSDAKPGLLGATTSRAEAQVMRLACLYALLDRSHVVRHEHLMAGLAVWEYCQASARFVFGVDLGDPVADELLRALRNCNEGLNRTDLHRLFKNHRRAAEIDRALALLLEHGRVERQIERTDGRAIERWRAIAKVRS